MILDAVFRRHSHSVLSFTARNMYHVGHAYEMTGLRLAFQKVESPVLFIPICCSCIIRKIRLLHLLKSWLTC